MMLGDSLVDESDIYQMIEYLRGEMVQVAIDKGSLIDHHVLALSQQLDEFIVLIQRMHLNRLKIPSQ